MSTRLLIGGTRLIMPRVVNVKFTNCKPLARRRFRLRCSLVLSAIHLREARLSLWWYSLQDVPAGVRPYDRGIKSRSPRVLPWAARRSGSRTRIDVSSACSRSNRMTLVRIRSVRDRSVATAWPHQSIRVDQGMSGPIRDLAPPGRTSGNVCHATALISISALVYLGLA